MSDDEFFESDSKSSNEPSELDKLYEHGTLCVRRKAGQMSKDCLLYLYARFKYITEGVCNVERPGGLFNFEAKSKWDAWKALGDQVSKEKCKQEYIDKLDQVLPNWREGIHSSEDIAEKKGTFGIRMSVMAQNEEELNPSDMTCFDMCREGSLAKLKEYFSKNQNSLDKLINQRDDNQMTMLMWACDRGQLDIVVFLVENKADVNLQDNEGQSCLHYAVSCEHFEIINYLVSLKQINLNLCDNDGLKPIDLTENKDIQDLFNL